MYSPWDHPYSAEVTNRCDDPNDSMAKAPVARAHMSVDEDEELPMSQ